MFLSPLRAAEDALKVADRSGSSAFDYLILIGASNCQLPDRGTAPTVARELRLLTITSLWEMV